MQQRSKRVERCWLSSQLCRFRHSELHKTSIARRPMSSLFSRSSDSHLPIQ
ncbi:hypothetical protein HER21_17810 [Pseudomonas sp. BGM005]|nr:hypothetical protein [Pseudomonas sp. BG5]